ncbi:MAG TPA: phosphoribosylamine--glycine ligase [bacterium]|nr:MAG: Phosphoribosylamine--glycine ligase [bacterium ADurb.Bin270]HPW45041.1 phosphoribosylamine--glycine ligase [bacterium]HQC50790.1 phosphoribosylamine--glycine ligase [bacterium]HQG13507.1 phosphoribosylamine--glycine ligase [bacterium]HQH81098.1 phosphoribosylamine--glycine ligase [bacterium]
MDILVVGGGGREHALVWKISQSSRAGRIYCAPGNPGISKIAECVEIAADDIQALLSFAKSKKIGMTVVGPEAPLSAGIVDAFKRAGLKIFGPTREAAELESSKVFAKDFCVRYNIPTARAESFTDPQEAKRFLLNFSFPAVVKADGLASGKGVVICRNIDEASRAVDDMMVAAKFGSSGKRIIIEEFLRGVEASFIAICDGNHVLPLDGSQDHKAAYDGDLGPNTGGMGAISPAGVLTGKMVEKVMEKIILPTSRGMVTEGRPFVGVLYAGLMIDGDDAKVLEYNVRFGDPETQALLMRLKTDIVEIFDAAITGDLDKVSMTWDPRHAVCVVMAAQGYPGDCRKGAVISGLDEAGDLPDTFVFHAGTKLVDGDVTTNGGRVLGVTALGSDAGSAIKNVYDAVSKISFEGGFFRKDIGSKSIKG